MNFDLSTITPREREVLVLFAEGYRTPEIASSLNRSPKTVECYRTRIRNKLEITQRTEWMSLLHAMRTAPLKRLALELISYIEQDSEYPVELMTRARAALEKLPSVSDLV